MTLLGSCTEMLDLTNILIPFCCMMLFNAKIILLILRHNEIHEPSQKS